MQNRESIEIYNHSSNFDTLLLARVDTLNILNGRVCKTLPKYLVWELKTLVFKTLLLVHPGRVWWVITTPLH